MLMLMFAIVVLLSTTRVGCLSLRVIWCMLVVVQAVGLLCCRLIHRRHCSLVTNRPRR